MNRDELIRHLNYYADLMIRDFGLPHARNYLRGCIPIWRDAYGTDIASHMGKLIKQKLDNNTKERK